MKPRIDLTGKVFGSLTVTAFAGSKSEGKYVYAWECLCDCGLTAKVLTSHLKSGAITTCGCKKRSRGGATSDPLFRVWSNMVRRCTDPKHKSYKNYGARGIIVCKEWMDPAAFIADMSPRPEGMTIERVDNSGPYSASNCVWADRTVQANNKRNVPTIQHEGRELSVAQWAKVHGMHPETLRSRLLSGMPLGEAVKSPTTSIRW